MSPWDLVCFDMDRVLVTHDSTWQWVYDRLGVSNEESLIAYEAGALHEWEWLQKDLRLIEGGCHRMLGRSVTVNDLRAWTEDVPLDHGLDACIAGLLDDGHDVAIISGGMNAPRIASPPDSRRPDHGSVAGEASTHGLPPPSMDGIRFACLLRWLARTSTRRRRSVRTVPSGDARERANRSDVITAIGSWA